MSLLGVGLLLGTLVETSKIRGSINKNEVANYIENFTTTIIDKICKKVQFIEPRVKDELIKITDSKSIDEFENIVLNKESILDKYGYYIFSNLYWLYYEKEIFPINWILEYIWQPLCSIYESGNISFEIKYDIFMNRYYLFAISYSNKSGLDVVLLLDNNNKDLIFKIKEILEKLSGSWMLEPEYQKAPLLHNLNEKPIDNHCIESWTQYVLDNIKEIDETKYFYNKFDYQGYFNVYKK